MDAKKNGHHGQQVLAHSLHEYGEEFNHLLHEKKFWELAGLSLLIATTITIVAALSDPYGLQVMFQAYGL